LVRRARPFTSPAAASAEVQPRSDGTIDDTAEEVSARRGTGIAVRCDHSDDAQVKRMEVLERRLRLPE
jgi:hypothetical protein